MQTDTVPVSQSAELVQHNAATPARIQRLDRLNVQVFVQDAQIESGGSVGAPHQHPILHERVTLEVFVDVVEQGAGFRGVRSTGFSASFRPINIDCPMMKWMAIAARGSNGSVVRLLGVKLGDR